MCIIQDWWLLRSNSHIAYLVRVTNIFIGMKKVFSRSQVSSSQIRDWVVIAHNIRSAYNVGGIFRTADGAGAKKVYLTGYSPIPSSKGALYKTSAQKMIAKTALGAEMSVPWEYVRTPAILIERLRKEDWKIVALEQDTRSVSFDDFELRGKAALIIGNEPRGIDRRIRDTCDFIVEIPMYGSKNSLNVVVALGIVGYTMRSKK